MKRLIRLCMLLTLTLAGFMLGGCNGARDTAVNLLGAHEKTGFLIKEITRGARTRRYAVFIPLDYSFTAPSKHPVIIFLHGSGESGNLSKGNLRVGLGPIVADLEATFNFIVIFPQSDNGSWDPDGQNAMDVIAELDAVAKAYPGADLDRVSLTGIGSGGHGTWTIGAKYRNRFAALVPIASNASPFDEARNLAGMPIRAYHNSGDIFAASWYDTVMVEKIRSFGGKAEMFSPEGLGNNCWEYAYGETDLLQWLAQQRRTRGFGAAPAPASSSTAASSLHANSAAYVSAPQYP
jgi:predicted peptidase